LRGHYELENINLLDEISRLSDLFSAVSVKSIREEEKVTADNKNARYALRAQIFESENKEVEGERAPRQLKYYYYKRWLWIQFSWCALDVYADLSSVMAKFAEHSEFQSSDVDNDLAINLIKIIKESKQRQMNRGPGRNQAGMRSSTSLGSLLPASDTKLPRLMTANKISKELGMRLDNTMQEVSVVDADFD
jgi:hypothetical protein